MKNRRAFGVSALCLSLACSALRSKSDDAGADGATAAVDDGPIVNENEVTRSPRENKISEKTTTARDVVVRKSPPDGPAISTLASGTAVEKISSLPEGFLVVFKDQAGKRMMGWIETTAFVAAPLPTATTVNKLLVPVKDAGIKDSGTSGVSDAGVTVPDAGASTDKKPDAGASTDKKADAGAAPVEADKRKMKNGQCDAGWAKSGEVCRKPCTADSGCPSSQKCKALTGGQFCSN